MAGIIQKYSNCLDQVPHCFYRMATLFIQPVCPNARKGRLKSKVGLVNRTTACRRGYIDVNSGGFNG